jgi:hypothetical protein
MKVAICYDIENDIEKYLYIHYPNPNLGLTTKAKVCEVVGQEGSSIITSHVPGSAKECEGMNLHTSK